MSGDDDPAARYERAIAERDRFASLIELAPDGFFVSAVDGRYVEVNEAGCRLFGYSRAEILGKTVFDFLTPEEATRLRHLQAQLQDDGVHRFQWMLQRKDGSHLPIEVNTRLLPDGQRQSIIRDVSEAKRIERERRLELEAMERLQQVTSLFLRNDNADVILDAILDAAIAISEADFGTLQVFDPSRSELQIIVQRGLPAWWLAFWNGVSAQQGSCGTALVCGRRVIVEDVAKDAIFADPRLQDIQQRAGIRAVQSTPVIERSGAMLGMISTHYKAPGRPPERALRLMDLLARQAADLLERRRTEDELRRAEAKFRGIIAVAADAIISIDADRTITEWNQGAERMFGYRRTQAIGALLDIMIPERHRAAYREQIMRFASEPEAIRGMDHQSAIGLRQSGEEFPIEATISRLSLDGEQITTIAVRDVSERKRTQREQTLLAEVGAVLASLDYEETLQRLVEVVVRSLGDFVVVLRFEEDSRLRPVAAASHDPAKAWCMDVIVKLPFDRAPAHPVWKAFETRHAVVENLTPEAYERVASSPDHLPAIRAAQPRSVMAVPLLVGEHCLGVLTIVSASRAWELRDLRIAEELGRRCALFLENTRLHRAEKRMTQARDEMLGVVAHDLRSPLNTIVLQARVLRLSESSSRKPAEAIERAAARMNRIIDDLLDIAQLEMGRLKMSPARICPAGLVAEVFELQEARITSQSLQFRSGAAETLPEVLADKGRMFQVFENLIGNAARFTPRGSISLGARRADNEVVFWVADTGIGITANQLPYIFERFWQVRHLRGSAGLGLAIVKLIVEAQGGRVWVESQPGVGSTFFFTVPVAAEPQRNKVNPGISSHVHEAREAVLVAEDRGILREQTPERPDPPSV